MLPKARRENISVQKMPGEVLLYDHERKKVHCLNHTSAFVWNHCDGQTAEEELARLVQDQLHIADPGPIVQLALEQLSRRNLLEEAPRVPVSSDVGRLSRRDALKKLVAAAVALPIIMTITPRVFASETVSIGKSCPPGTTLCGISENERTLCCGSGETCINGACVRQQAQQQPAPGIPRCPAFAIGSPCGPATPLDPGCVCIGGTVQQQT